MSAADHALSAKIAALSSAVSPYPPSFDNSSWLYACSLFSLLGIEMLCATTLGWMIRDMWRDRMRDHPLSLAFMMRLIFAILSFVGCLRIFPDILRDTLWGEVTGATMSHILALGRIADIMALPDVMLWQGLLLLIYPPLMLNLTTQQARSVVILDPYSVWPRLARGVVIIVVVALIASLMAYAKWTMGHHAG